MSTTYMYNPLNRLTELTTTGPGGVVQSHSLTLGPTGERACIDEAGSVARVFAYDELGRLTEERVTLGGAPVYEKAFTYDAVGNRTTQATTGTGAPGSPTASGSVTYAYDARDRLTSDSGAVYSFDLNGNRTAKSGEAIYTWDFDDRLTRVEKADGTLVEHAYDADGNRVRTTVTPPGGAASVMEYLVDATGPSVTLWPRSTAAVRW